MISVESLTKVYGGKTVVDDLTFDIKPGIVTGFLGPNGAGKSTTMRMIVGLDRPSAGRALVDGKHYTEYTNPLYKVGTLLDAKWVHPKRSARAHLSWLAAANGIPQKRVDEVLELVGLTEAAKRHAGKFSLGMHQRLGLAAALLGDPEILILDEPVNGLDPEGIRWVREFLRSLADEGRTILVSSHLLSEMSQTADHLIVIGRGRLISNSSMHEFIKASSEVVTVVRADQPEVLADLLRAQGAEVERFVDNDGREALKVPGRDSDWVGDIAFEAGLRVREVSEMRPSLEEAYIRMTGDSVEYHANVAPAGRHAAPAGGAAPAQAMPAQPAPGQAGAQPMPAQPNPAQPNPAQPGVAGNAPAQQAPGQHNPAQPAPTQNIPTNNPNNTVEGPHA